jgi:hypothetical protein
MRGEITGLQSNGRQGAVSYVILESGVSYGELGTKTFGKKATQTYLCDPVSKRKPARSSKG